MGSAQSFERDHAQGYLVCLLSRYFLCRNVRAQGLSAWRLHVREVGVPRLF